MLYGRDDEQAALAELQQHALAGRGGALVVLGAPGAGKSALLAASPLDGLRCCAPRGSRRSRRWPSPPCTGCCARCATTWAGCPPGRPARCAPHSGRRTTHPTPTWSTSAR
ncbi:ATP-binding protein [Pseudonocardia benzenivorans]